VLNSKYDQWQLGNVLGADVPAFHDCVRSMQNCTTPQLQAVIEYGAAFSRQLGFRDNYFVDSCWSHCQLTGNGGWHNVAIDRLTAHDAVWQWYKAGFPRQAYRLDDCDVDEKKPCNPTCKK